MNNLTIRINNLRYLFNVDQNSNIQWANSIYFPFFILTISYLLSKIVIAKAKGMGKKDESLIIQLLIISVLGFIFSCFTLSTYRVEHLTVFLPFYFLIIGYSLNDLLKINKIAAFCLIAILIVLNWGVLSNYYEELETCGTVRSLFYWPHFSDSLYRLIGYLKEDKIALLNTIGPGFEDNLNLLTDGEIFSKACIDFSSFKDCIDLKGNKYYLYDFRSKPWLVKFEELAKEKKATYSNKTFYDRKGVPEFMLIKVN